MADATQFRLHLRSAWKDGAAASGCQMEEIPRRCTSAASRESSRRQRPWQLVRSASLLAALGIATSSVLSHGHELLNFVAGHAASQFWLGPGASGAASQSSLRELHVRRNRGVPVTVPNEDLSAVRKKMSIQPASWSLKPKPPTLPAGLFKPKASLSQVFLADPNYIYKMVSAVEDSSPGGRTVLEVGPGTGALTSRLNLRYPDMVAVEIDQRALRVLSENVPGATVIRSDALLVNYTKLAELRGGPLNVVGNLPYHVTSQIMFCLADHARSVETAHVTMQKEMAERICAKPNTKKYGIPSIAFQLWSDPKILFDVPPTAFFPRPNAMSSYVKFDFKAAEERRKNLNIDPRDLRNLTKVAFRKRGQMLHNSLKKLLECHTTLIDELPREYSNLRPAQMEPWEFVHLTQLMFGKKEFPHDRLRRAWRGEFGRTVKGDD
eukprot:TRINITY_DN28964_c0_g1_i1.p1 TRINITY_DN28964_c0_g1~~TRINITY_DN28964_c0_g1_i1.p1  ORF type:complete len:437 (-),score=76.08 TRINITY_DN28964_c0_g1_i1:85-1395(-)